MKYRLHAPERCRPDHLYFVKGPDGIDRVFERLSHGILAIDTETSGLDWWFDRVGGICLAAGRTAAFFYQDALRPAAQFVRHQVKRMRELVFHNGKFDMHMLRSSFGIHIDYPVHDTTLSSFLVDNRGVHAFRMFGENPHSLKPLAQAYLDPDAQDPEKEMKEAIRRRIGTGVTKDNYKGMWPILIGTEDEYLATLYGAMDPWYTLKLHELFIERLRHWPQPQREGDPYPSLMSLYENERWLLLALRDMEERGIMMDQPFLEQWRRDLSANLEQSKYKLHKMVRKYVDIQTFNWNSPKQLGELLFSKMGLQHGGTTAAGNFKTDEVTLKKLTHPIGEMILKYREDTKQHGTYAEGLINAIKPDGAIHTSFNQNVRTGRMSSRNPNLQQQTRESGVRKAYKPRKGLVLRFADYSQAEMRFAAHSAREYFLIDGFCNIEDFDVHAATAQKMFGVKVPTARQRKFAKIINFTTLYGGGRKQVMEKLIELMTYSECLDGLKEFGYRLRAGENPFLSLADLIRERYFKQLPAMRKITYARAELAEGRGFTINEFGRHRYFDPGDTRWYAAFNSETQGNAVDQAKRGLVKSYRELQLERGTIAILLQIHDEMVYESDGDPVTDRRVMKLSAELKRFRVPIVADISGSDTNWQSKTKVKL